MAGFYVQLYCTVGSPFLTINLSHRRARALTKKKIDTESKTTAAFIALQ